MEQSNTTGVAESSNEMSEELLKFYLLLEDDEVILYKGIHVYSKNPISSYEELKTKKVIQID